MISLSMRRARSSLGVGRFSAFSNSDDQVWQTVQKGLGDAGFEIVHLLNKGQPSIKGVKGVTGKEHVTTLDLMLCLKTRGGRGQVMSLTNPRWFVTPVSGSVSEASRTACPSSCFPALSSFPRQFRRRG